MEGWGNVNIIRDSVTKHNVFLADSLRIAL